MNPRTWVTPLLLASLTCAAQGFPPDQVDLQSSYCLGVLNARAAVQAELTSGKVPLADAYRPVLETMVARNNAGLSRLRAYLAVRFQTVDVTGMLIATGQGGRDMSTAAAQLKQCGQTCTNDACVLACKASSEIASKLARCDGLSFLPY